MQRLMARTVCQFSPVKLLNGTAYDLTLQTGGDISIDGDLGATDALKNLAIGANGTVEFTGNILTTENIEIIAQGVRCRR